MVGALEDFVKAVNSQVTQSKSFTPVGGGPSNYGSDAQVKN